MRDMIAGGGVLDLATLHPLGALIVIVGAAIALRAVWRGLGSHRRMRSGGPHRAV